MKKLGKYLSITFLLLLGLCCAGVLYLFFVPGSNLFNITYISYNETKSSQSFNTELVSKIVLNSYNYPVKITTTDSNSASVKVHNNSFGFAMKKDNYANITTKLKEGVLTFNIKEPVGFAINNSSAITLYLPNKQAVDLELKNNASLTKIINGNVTINNLKYTSKEGDIIVEKGKINGDLNLDLHMADFNIRTEAETNLNNVQVSVTTGKFNAADEKFGTITVLSNDRGVIWVDECDRVEMSNKLSGGRIEANKVNTINVRTSDTHIKIKEVLDGAIVNLSKYGTVTIDNLTGFSDIMTTNGNITLNKANSIALLRSVHGDIKVKNAYLKIDAKTTYGNINVTFAEDAQEFSTTNDSRSLIALTKNGRIIASGVDYAVVTVEKSGSGSAFITYNKVSGNSSFVSDVGSISIRVNKESAFELNSQTTSGAVRINLTQTPVYNGWTNKIVNEKINCTSSDDKINISTNSGGILMLDSNFY